MAGFAATRCPPTVVGLHRADPKQSDGLIDKLYKDWE